MWLLEEKRGFLKFFFNSCKSQWGKNAPYTYLSVSPKQLIIVVRSLILEFQVFLKGFSHVLDFRKQREQKAT